jgi:proteasome accessory factor B
VAISKAERLLNLFFVLLNTKRPISRNDIRQKVSGYENCESDSSFERMFERDKDELRSTGIKIETLSMDTLFEDELGYRIDQNIFITKVIDWSRDERIMLNLASAIWKNTEFENLAKIASIKTGNVTSEISDSDSETINDLNMLNYRIILQSLQSKSALEFQYVALDDSKPRNRKVIAKRLYRLEKYWYIEAIDIAAQLIKNYQINRIYGQIRLAQASQIEVNLLKSLTSPPQEKKSIEVTTTEDSRLLTHITGGLVAGEDKISFDYFDSESFVNNILFLSSIITDINHDEVKKLYISKLIDYRNVLK